MGGIDESRSSERRGEPSSEGGAESEHPSPVKKHRRVTTPPPTGSDPHPTGEPERHLADENDERLKGDKPPHWG